MDLKYKLTIFAIFLLFLSFIKFIFGKLTSTPVLVADSIHSLSDFVGFLGLIFTVILLERKKDERFPYGYYKIESFTTFIISLFILYVAYEIFIESLHFERSQNPGIAIILSLLSSLFSFIIAKFVIDEGKKSNLKSIEIYGKEQKYDSLISLIVAFSILLSIKFSFIQTIATFFISILVGKTAIEGLSDSIKSLLDMTPDKDLKVEIEKFLKKEKVEFSDFRLRKAGPCFFLDITIKLEENYKLNDFYKLANHLTNEIKNKWKDVCAVFIMPEKRKKLNYLVVLPIKGDEINDEFSRSEEFAFVKIENGIIASEKIEKNPFEKKELRKGAAIARWLINKGVDVVITKNIGYIAFNSLRNNFVLIYKGEGNWKENVNKFLFGELKEIEEPTKVRI